MATKRRPTSLRSKKSVAGMGRAIRVQYGVLPYTLTEVGSLQIVLVTTRQTRRWIIPKGWPIKGLKPPQSAAREAYEEAGVRGKVGAKSIGVFSCEKRMEESGVVTLCEVQVFPMPVKRQLEAWPEAHQREAQWFEARNALAAVKIDGLRELIKSFLKKRVKKSVTKRARAKAASKAKAARNRIRLGPASSPDDVLCQLPGKR